MGKKNLQESEARMGEWRKVTEEVHINLENWIQLQ
jgi:hypothetical protein